MSYSNTLGLMTSPYDIQLIFSHLQPGFEENVICEKALVSMSPNHAKAMAIALTKAVKEWEEKNGEIKLPAKI